MLSGEGTPSAPDYRPCPTGTLVSWTNDAAALAPAWCKRWSCENCGWRKARDLAARIMASKPSRFVTLTCKPAPGIGPERQLDAMNAAWRALWKRIKRTYGHRARGYVKVVELHKSGSPHLHLALATPFIHQSILSRWWREITGSPIVDIRAIRTERGLARYLSKYLSKCTDVVSRHRKWSQSKSFLPPLPIPELGEGQVKLTWFWTNATREHFEAALLADGWLEIEHVWLSETLREALVPAL